MKARGFIITMATVLAILFAIAFIGWYIGAWDKAESAPVQETQLYRGVPLNEHLLKLDKQALDQGYHDYVVKLWMVWLSSGAPKEAEQMRSGLQRARASYAIAAAQIELREKQLEQQRQPK